MNDTTPVTIHISRNTKDRLERLAKDTDRNGSALAAEAIEAYLGVEEGQVAGIKKALASLDRGEGVPHDKVKAWVASWGTEANLEIGGGSR